MFGKDTNVRWDETIKYLNTKFPCPGLQDALGAHIEKTVAPGLRKKISEELSLGYRSDGKDDPTYAATTEKRHALRGLFLCQRVYYSDLWSKRANFAGDAFTPFSLLKPDWRKQSMQFWGQKNEKDILGGIGMFAPVANSTRDNLQAAAHAGPPNGKGVLPANLELSRDDTECVGAAETCYNGITAWLVRSGLASMRWFMQDSAPNNKIPCDRLFGTGEEIWSANTPFKPESKVPDVGIGFIIHMWNTENFNWNGHWVVSNGDGTICGVNNGEVTSPQETVLKKYTNSASLKNQFLGYGGQQCKEIPDPQKPGFLKLVPIDPPRWNKAVMVKIDPLQIPNLI